MLKVMYVHSSDELYGADRVLLELASGLDQGRFASLVVLPNDLAYENLLSNELEKAGIPHHSLGLAVLRRRYMTPWGMVRYLGRLGASTLRLCRMIRREGVNVVHSNTSAVLSGALASRITKRRHVWHVHEIIQRPRLLWGIICRLLYGLSDEVVAVSAAVREHMIQTYPPLARKTVVIHNGLRLDRFAQADGSGIRREFGIGPEEAIVGMTSRISAWKGQGYLVSSIPAVLARFPQTRFLIVGGTVPGQEEDLASLQETINDLHLGDRVILTGFRRDALDLVHALDVFVLPSIRPDPLPTSVLEAMACGKPVVATAQGGAMEMVQEGVTGFLVPLDDPDALAEAICRLIGDPALGKRMGQAGRARVEDAFSLARFVAQFQALYERAPSAARPGRDDVG